MSAPRYAAGVIALAIVLGGFGLAGVALRRRVLPAWRGAEAALAGALLTLALLIGTLELLGTLRLFRLVPIVLAGVIAGALGLRSRPAREPGTHPRLRAETIVALIGGLAVGAQWLAPTLDSLAHGIRTVDTLWYHLPWAASFAQTGQITSLRFTDLEYLTAFYPATAEMLHGAGIVLLGGDTLSPLINLGWLALALLAAWCVGARRGRGPATLLATAAVLGTTMMDLSQAGSAANDVVGIFFLTAALALWLDGAPAWLPALAAGLAVATKLSLAAPAVLLVAGALVHEGRRLRRAAPQWLGGLVLGGGFWYARNLIAVGNPLPWVSLPGLAVPAAPLQAHTGYSVSRYLTSSDVWSHFLSPGLHAGIGVGWPGLLVLAILAPLLLVVRGGEARLRVVGVVALLSLAAYVVTPETAAGPAGDPAGFAFNLRYAAPALTLCLLCLALCPVPRRAAAAVWALPGLLLVLDLARASPWNGHRAGEAVAIAVVVGLAGSGVLALRAGAGRRHLPPAAVPITLVALAVIGFFVQRSYLHGRYRYAPGVSQMSHVWAAFRNIRGARVALSGTYGGYFAYPLWGVDLSDPVTYLGHHGPHGSFTAIASCAEFRRALDAGGFSYLVATPARDPWHPHRLIDSPEAAWVSADPHARAVLVHHGAGSTVYVFRLTGPLDPHGCG